MMKINDDFVGDFKSKKNFDALLYFSIKAWECIDVN